MSIRSPRTPTFDKQGFLPLDAADMNENENYRTGIPLSTIKTSGSSTGARKPSDQLPRDFNTQDTFSDPEKRSRFRGGKRKVKRIDSTPKRIGTDGEEVIQTRLGKFYSKVVNASVVTKFLFYVAPPALLLAAPVVVYAILDNNDGTVHKFLSTDTRTFLFWLWILIVWLSLWITKLVAKIIPWVFVTLAGVVSSGTRKYASILKALEWPLSFVLWAVTSLVTFTALIASDKLNHRTSSPGWISVMTKVLAPILVGTILLFVEKLLIQLLSVSYHGRSYNQKIKESKRSIYILGLLYDASRALFPMYTEPFEQEDYIINDSIEALIGKVTGQTGSATPLKLVGAVGRAGDKVTSVFGNIATEITGKQVFNPNAAHSIVVEALEKTRSSEALARRIWQSFVAEGQDTLHEEDLVEVLGPGHHEEAAEAFSSLDTDGNGDISMDEMVSKVVEIGRTRKDMAKSMRDVGQAIGVLDRVAVWVLALMVVFIFIAFQVTTFVTTLATAGTTLLSLSFVFATSVQEFLGSCIFLFIKHPYDVGDRVDISSEQLVVEQISLLYCVFKRIDNMKMVQIPNIVLNNLWVENVSRSTAMKEQLDMFISFDTSLEDIELLRTEMQNFVRDPENSRDFQQDIILEATGIGSMDKLQLKVEIMHKSNWHNETIRASRRSKFMCALVLALRKVPIYGPGGGGEALGGPTNPGYSVSVSDAEAAEARAKAKDAKEEKRLVPTQSRIADGAELGPENETNAADNLNARRPTMDAAHQDSDWPTTGQDEEKFVDSASDRKRDSQIEALRSDMIKRQSTRGRRKPGTSVPSAGNESQPGFAFTPASPYAPGRTFPRDTVDEEAEMGMNEPLNQPLSSSPYMPGAGTGYTSYNAFPQPTAEQQARQQQNTAYTGAQVNPPPKGRSRGLSLKKTITGSSQQQ